MKNKKKLVAVILAVVIASIGLFASCGKKSGNNNSDTFNIGLIGPLTGDAAVYGNAVKNSAELAINEINKNGGINGMQVKLLAEDDETDPEKSINAYNTLKDKGMDVLLGTVTTKPCLAVKDLTKDDGIFQLTPSGSGADCVKYDNCFQVCFTDPNQGIASADYISNKKLGNKIGIIYNSSDPYSSGIYSTFKTRAAQNGLNIVSEEAFTDDSKTDFTAQLSKAKAAGADLIFIPIYYQEASSILKQANNMSYKPTFFGVDGLDGILGIDGFDKSLAENAILLTPFSANSTDEKTVSFVKAYRDAGYAEETLNQFGADAYDGVYIIKAAAEKGKITKDMSAKEICNILKAQMSTLTYDGVTGSNMTWKASGEVSKTPKGVKIAKNASGIYEYQPID
ncbi:MAG: ABC transporter substrate-binding protein [Candidatus Fimenecus sp.]